MFCVWGDGYDGIREAELRDIARRNGNIKLILLSNCEYHLFRPKNWTNLTDTML